MFNKPISERTLLVLVALSLVVSELLFSTEFANVYLTIAVAWLALFLLDKKVSFPTEKANNNKLMSVLIAIGAYASFIVFATILTSIFQPSILPTTGSFIDKMMAVTVLQGSAFLQATNPVLAKSLVVMFINWSIIIGISETSLTARIFDYAIDSIKNRTLLNISVLIAFVGAFITFLHLASKDLANVPLMITFVFFTLTCGLIYWRKQSLEAIMLHVISNGIAVWNVLNGIVTPYTLYALLIGTGFLVLMINKWRIPLISST